MQYVCKATCMYIYMYVCLCVCVCVRIYLENATVKIIVHFRYCVEDKKRYNNNCVFHVSRKLLSLRLKLFGEIVVDNNCFGSRFHL